MVLPKIISLGFLSFGVFILMQVVLPIASYQVWEIGQTYNNKLLISPQQNSDSEVLGISIENNGDFSAIISNLKREVESNYDEFTITIPKLKVVKSTVLVDSNDLSLGLAALPGTALPGEKGNLFISGHSALSKIFSFKNIPFSKLPDLKNGDQIIVEALGVEYKYQVVGIKIVDPKDLSVISPPDPQGRYISLMTCVPPGLNFKRLVVLGKML